VRGEIALYPPSDWLHLGHVPVILPLSANYLIWDPARGRILATIPGNARNNGNSVISIDPLTGQITSSIFAGSNPNRMALARDNTSLYVGLDGANAVVRLNLDSQEAGKPFSLGGDSFFGPFLAEDIEVMPGDPDTIAVSRYVRNISPRHQGVAIIETERFW
jgi:sugar lactone lactonase YvrE